MYAEVPVALKGGKYTGGQATPTHIEGEKALWHQPHHKAKKIKNSLHTNNKKPVIKFLLTKLEYS